MTDDTGRYAGDLDVTDVWQRLEESPDALLIDVRSRAEWAFVGVPDLSALGKDTLFAEWQRFPDMERDPAFADTLSAELSARGVGRDAALFFLCRSGGRSAAAAAAMTEAGFTQCFNVAGGFEGRLDATRHRGTVEGWKAARLPWIQS